MINTQENIKYNPNVVLTVLDEKYECLRMFGVAEYYTDGEYFELDKKYLMRLYLMKEEFI